MNNKPIGILDSGLGGLTIWHEIVQQLPHESTVYIGDSANTPYGVKSPEEIFELARKCIEFLLTKEVKLIVTACNSITVSCVDQLREAYPAIPIVGTVPAIKPAGEQTKNKRIGILATTRTTTSDYQTELINQFASDCTVLSHGTDGIVPLIERGELASAEMTATLERELAPFQEEGIDTLVLGCTHFPFVKVQMQKILGSSVTILDSSEAIARRVTFLLEQSNSLASVPKPEYAFFTTGNAAIAKKILHATIKRSETVVVTEVSL